MELEVTRRDFLRVAGLALAGTVASAASAQEKEQAKEKKEGEKKAPSSGEEPKKEEAPKAKAASKNADDDADWDEAWKSSGSEETRTCPQCGAAMYRQGRTWTCNNCGYSYVE